MSAITALIFAALATGYSILIGWQFIHGNVAGAAVLTPIFVLPTAALCVAAVWVPAHFWRTGSTGKAFTAAIGLFILAVLVALFAILTFG